MRSYSLGKPDAHIRFHDIPGPGIPILFVHGLGCASSCDFPRIVADLQLARRRFILVDLLGSGFSDKPADFGYSVEDHARTLLDLVNGLGLRCLDLFGHSMGGSIAIVAAAMEPSRICHLVLAEPNLDAGGGIFSRGIAGQSESDYVARGHAEEIRLASATGNHIWAGSMSVASPVAIHRGATSLVRGGVPSWREQLLALPIPRTVIFAERTLPDPDISKLVNGGISVEVVPDAGHSLMWDNPSGLAFAISQALAKAPI